jgi:hypothetical protein
MRKLLLLVCLAVGLVLAATPAQAATTVENHFPVEFTVDVCGDTITLSGTELGVFTSQPLGQEGYLATFHLNTQGLTGTSSSGTTYHGTTVITGAFVLTPTGGSTFTSVNAFNIVGTSGAPLYALEVTFHITMSPTGEITADVNNAHVVDCV